MGLISTQELLNKYYESVKGTSYEKTRAQIDRPELYAYEQKIGKELIDMTPDDLKGLFIEFGNKRKGKEIKYLTATKSSDQLKTQLNLIFEFYIDKVQPIKNPFSNRQMKGVELTKSLAKGREVFRWSTVEDIIIKVHRDYESDRADYIELIILMFYNGFSKAEEIVELQADMINHYHKTVKLPDRSTPIRLSDRCYDLLTKFNKLETIAGWRAIIFSQVGKAVILSL